MLRTFRIQTELTRRFSLDYPIVLAPMGGVSGGRLAAAVSNAGGLGLVGGGYGDLAWLDKELSLVKAATSRKWGVGLITWSLTNEALRLTLRSEPSAVMLSFGDPSPWAASVKDAGSLLICQVQDRAGAAAAVAAGADFIVAQGTEAGGHGGQRATLPLVPAIVDMVAPIPVLAAGGIADGRGLAAALVLGAQGSLIGTRFYASSEALGHENLKQELVARSGDDTIRTSVFDTLRGYSWPDSFEGRAIRNAFVTQWHHRKPELAAHSAEQRSSFQLAQTSGDVSSAMIWAGECVDLIQDIQPAAELVRAIGTAAEVALDAARGFGGSGTRV
jgi:nitronate monooxygenase